MFEEHEPFFVQDKLIELVSPIQRTASRWNFRCPVCGDSKKKRNKKRGNYYPKNNSFYCFNCDTSAQGLWVIAKLADIPIDKVKREFLDSIGKGKHNREILPEEVKEEPKQKVIKKIPDNWIDVPPEIYEAIITKRKILQAPYAPKDWQFYMNKDSKRLVIPWTDDGEMNYYQERAIYAHQAPKYTFPFNTVKAMFGLTRIDESFPYIFGLEGCFDSIWVKNGTCQGGLTLTEDQQELVEKTMCDYVYFFDNQGIDETSMKKSLKLAQENTRANIFIWPRKMPEKDVNEYCIRHENNIFNDETFLESRIFRGARAILELKNL